MQSSSEQPLVVEERCVTTLITAAKETSVKVASSKLVNPYHEFAISFGKGVGIDLLRLYILFSQYRSCANTQEIRSFVLFIKKSACRHIHACMRLF